MRTLQRAVLTALAILPLAAGCGDDNPAGPGDDLDPSLAGMNEAGAGYDVFDNYADVTKCRARILDAAKLVADGRDFLGRGARTTQLVELGAELVDVTRHFLQLANERLHAARP